IDEMDKWEGSQLNEAKNILAYELTKLVHGEEEAEKARGASTALFIGGGDLEHIPTTELTAADLTEGTIGILDLMLKCDLVPSKKEARRLIEQGGVEANGTKVTDVAVSFGADAFAGEGLMIKKGKKVFHRARMG
ncbi:MAG: S4 domain-containing protein, partial [Oscillospiraceae bacterium]